MTQQADLLYKIDTLPPKYLGEVIDFVGYLQQKARRETPSADFGTLAMSSDEWVNPLFGLAKAKGASLTLDRFMEIQHEEIELENENDKRLLGQ